MNDLSNEKFRVAHIPQVPMLPFYVPVNSIEEGMRVIDTLNTYELLPI